MKIKTTKLLIAVTMMGCELLCAPTTFAALLVIDNPSFETIPSGVLPGVCAVRDADSALRARSPDGVRREANISLDLICKTSLPSTSFRMDQ